MIYIVYSFALGTSMSDTFDFVLSLICILVILIFVSFRSTKRFALILFVAISWSLALAISISIAYKIPNYYFDFNLSVSRELYKAKKYSKSIELLQNRIHSSNNCRECYMLLAFNYYALASLDSSNTLSYLDSAKANFIELSLRRELSKLENSILEVIELKLSTLQ